MNNKEKLLHKLNKAFANNDVDTVLQLVSKDIAWDIVGDEQFEGIAAFRNALEEMKSEHPFIMVIENILARGFLGVGEGKMSDSDGKTYAFCDIYEFNKSSAAKVKSITSYFIELDQPPVKKNYVKERVQSQGKT